MTALKTATAKALSGGQAFIKAALQNGVKVSFCVPGESYLDILNACYDHPELKLVTTRQEGGAAFMAEAYGKLTGKPALLMVTRGPGACNASIGIHTAFQDSTPMVVIIGDVHRDHIGREAFQEIDFVAMFTPIAKAAYRIHDAKRIPEFVNKAFYLAQTGRPGPVVLSIPEDVLKDTVSLEDFKPTPQIRSQQLHPEDLKPLQTALAEAHKPLFILGGNGWSDQSCADLQKYLESHHLPVATGFRRQDLAQTTSPSYAGEIGLGSNPKLLAAVREADLLVVIGSRLGEIISQGYTLFEAGRSAHQKLIHIHAEEHEIHNASHPYFHLTANVNAFVAALQGLNMGKAGKNWQDWTQLLHQNYLDWTAEKTISLAKGDQLNLSKMFRFLSETMPINTIFTNDAGNFAGWGHRYLNYGRPRRQLAPVNGAMGYGLPAAIAAKIADPTRPVISFSGDGGFMMTSQEIAVALQEGINPIFVVMNNGMYGTIRMHQELHYPGRKKATELHNPDFMALGKAYGCYTGMITKNADVEPIFKEALSQKGPSLIEVKVDAKMITTEKYLGHLD